MRRPLRLVDGAERAVDLQIDPTPSATVGELADLLAERTGNPRGMTLVSRWPVDERDAPPPREGLLRSAGPRAGSTVVLVAEEETAATSVRSPVRLVGPGGQERRLDYGTTRLGDATIDVGEQLTVQASGGSDARVDGAALLGSARLADGDLLTLAGTPWTVRVEGPLRPPAPRGWTRPLRRHPAVPSPHEPITVDLPTPPPAVRLPGFPVLSATVPLLMAVALWVATGSLLSAGFMVFSVVFVVASGLEARREARAEDRLRVQEFRSDLADVEQLLDERAEEQRRRHGAQGLTPAQMRALVAPGHDHAHPRVWERTSGPDGPPAMTVRLGTADRPTEDALVVPGGGRRVLRRELRELADARSRIADVATVDLAATGGLVVEGADETTAAMARSVVLQLVTLIGPDELGLEVVTSGDRAPVWSDTSWLPHRRAGCRPRCLVVDDGADPAATAALVDRLGSDRTVVVWIAPRNGMRPDGITATLRIDGGIGVLRVDRADGSVEVIDDIDLEPLELDESEPLARRLTALVPTVAPRLGRSTGHGHAGGGLPDSVRLSDVAAAPGLVVDPDAVVERWRTVQGRHLATPIGVGDQGGIVNLDLVHDGPHALVAGTTGAGKSELLRTLLVSAALHHGPDRLQLLLVDYKGGAAFGPLASLPHTVGTITDLTGSLAGRALLSLRAELRRRETAVAATGADRWPGAALLVVVDELATLVAEQPGFVDGLVDLAQRGRSLGIHLVLATQRPAGVVTDAIRANATMRLALRVADEEDSRDVVDTPAAAHLPREVPGRAVVRLGPARVATVQVAFCGAPWSSRPAIVVEPLHGPPPSASAEHDPAARSELETAVATAAAAAERSGIAVPRRPWVDPLPERIALDEIGPSGRAGTVSLGVVDRPDLQGREPLQVDLERDGGLVVVGASGSGRTTLIRTLAAQVARDPHGPWHVHVIDHGSRLADLVGVGAVGDVVEVHDTERVLRLLRSTDEEVSRRATGAPGPPAPRRLLVVDGIAAMEERYERLDRGEAMDLLARIARDGRAVGVHVVVTAHRRAEVPAALTGVLAARIVLRCATTDDAAAMGLDDAAASADLAPGRCRVAGHHAQVALALPANGSGRTDPVQPDPVQPRPLPVPRLPRRITFAEVATASRAEADPDHDPGLLAIALDADTLAPTHLDLRHHHGLVVGPPRSGVSTALTTISRAHPGARLLGRADAGHVVDACAEVIRRAATGRPSLLVLDHADELLDSADGDEVAAALAEVVRSGRDHPARVVLGGEVDAMSRCYHDVVAAVRRGRTGLLLGGDPELHGAVLHAALTRRSDLPPAPGRGWLLGPGVAHRVQVALP